MPSSFSWITRRFRGQTCIKQSINHSSRDYTSKITLQPYKRPYRNISHNTTDVLKSQISSQARWSLQPKMPLMDLLFESWSVSRFHIRSCIRALVMIREFTRKVVMKFLPAQYSWIWCKAFKAILSIQRFFCLTEYREVIVKYSLLIAHAGMQIRIWYWLRQRLTPDSFFN